MPNFNASMGPLMAQRTDPLAEGARYGKMISDIGQGVVGIKNAMNQDDKKAKVDALVLAYNRGDGAFEGMQGSLKTEKLVRLLMPLDNELSGRYAIRAKEEKAKEEKLAQNKAVSDARKGVSTEGLTPDGVESARLRAGAEKMMEYDPATGMEWLGKAEDREIKAQKAMDDVERAKREFTPGTPEYITSLLKAQDRLMNSIRYDLSLTDAQKNELSVRMGNIENEVKKYPMGRTYLGIPEPTKKEDSDPSYMSFEDYMTLSNAAGSLGVKAPVQAQVSTGSSPATAAPEAKRYTGSVEDFLAKNKPEIAKDGSYANLADLAIKADKYATDMGGTNVNAITLKSQLTAKSEQGAKNLAAADTREEVNDARTMRKYDKLDAKYPDFRTKSIPMAQNALTFVTNGDGGNIAARNNAVKVLSRMGSDEALTEQDFTRALGRDYGSNLWDRIMKSTTGAPAPISDTEWNNTIRPLLVQKINAVIAKRKKIEAEFGKGLLDDVGNLGGGGSTKKTAKALLEGL
ncbi:MAG: hypothetical protein [Bacteriophage sp.]|nr:MAG: hypothetical protein [Bacteriophage sp.]